MTEPPRTPPSGPGGSTQGTAATPSTAATQGTAANGAGARLNGRYELREVLGYGGMAEVRRGHDLRLGRDIAVKTLRPDLARDPAFLERFRREAQSAAALSHPSVVSIYDTGEEQVGDSAAPYIVMEYVDGRTLRDVLRADGRLLPHRALQVVADVLRALDYSHRAGIVHRDIKPGNVMLTRAGDVKVMDFGISRAMSAATSTMTATAAVVGTAAYLSPEQARGEHVDHRSDLYSTGCLLYELLTGQPPFVGDNPIAVAYQHVREDPVPPSQLVPDLPPGIDAVVLTAMAKNPAARYQSAAEMRADLERLLAGEAVRATAAVPLATTTVLAAAPVTPPEPRAGRRRAAYAGLALAALVVFVLAALAAKAVLSHPGGGAVATPDVVGLAKDAAVQKLEAAGLHADPSRTEPSLTVEAGKVIRQDPLPQISVRRGDTIALVISSGAPPTTVPDVTGDSLDDAEAALTKARLKAGATSTRDGPASAGTVLATDPPAGTQLDSSSSVGLVVASGSNAVPQVVQQGVSDAERALATAGFRYRVRTQVDPTAVPDSVLQQSPAGGTRVPVGTTVTIVVATAPPSPTPSPTPSAAPSSATPATPTPAPSGPPVPTPPPATTPPPSPSPTPSPTR